MMTPVFYNNKSFVITHEITPQTTVLHVSAQHGLNPLVPGKEYIVGTIVPRSGDGGLEIVHIIGVDATTFLIERGKEDTHPQSFLFGAVLELRLTAGELSGMNALKLRQDLSDEDSLDKGASLVARSSIRIDSVHQLRSYSGRNKVTAYLVGYEEDTPGMGSGEFFWTESTSPLDDGGIYFTAPGGFWTRMDPRRKLSYFGADPTGTHDSADAIERALLSVQDQQVLSSDKRIFVDGVFRLNRGIKLQEFKRSWALGFIGDKRTLSRFDYYGTDPVILEIPSSEISFRDCGARNMSSSVQYTFLKTKLADGRADMDVDFTRCYFYNIDTIHECYGRGSRDIDCVVGSCNIFHKIISPDPYSPGPYPGNQSVTTGMRRYVSANLMVDTLGSIFHFGDTGPARNYINEVTIHGTNGNGLVQLITGKGGLQGVSIKTGALVNCFGNHYAIECNFIRRSTIDLTVRGAYLPDVEPSTGIDGVISATSPDHTGIDEVIITGSLEGLRNSLVKSVTKLGALQIKMSLPEIFRVSTGASGMTFLNAPGIEDNRRVFIDVTGYVRAGFLYDSFQWIADASSRNRVLFGNVHLTGVPFPKPRAKGVAILPENASGIAVQHGLNRIPDQSEIFITPQENPGNVNYWVTSISATSFTINATSVTHGGVRIAWHVVGPL